MYIHPFEEKNVCIITTTKVWLYIKYTNLLFFVSNNIEIHILYDLNYLYVFLYMCTVTYNQAPECWEFKGWHGNTIFVMLINHPLKWTFFCYICLLLIE